MPRLMRKGEWPRPTDGGTGRAPLPAPWRAPRSQFPERSSWPERARSFLALFPRFVASRACVNAPPPGTTVMRLHGPERARLAGISRKGCGAVERRWCAQWAQSYGASRTLHLAARIRGREYHDKAPRRAPRRVVVLRRRLAAPAREKADREEGNDDDDDPQDSAEDAPPFDDTRSLRPFDPIQERLANDEAPRRAARQPRSSRRRSASRAQSATSWSSVRS
jgi:hypothetical protein